MDEYEKIEELVEAEDPEYLESLEPVELIEIEESEGDMEREKQGAKRYGLVTKCTMIGAMLPFAWGLGTLGSSYFNSLSGHNCADGLKYKSCVSRYEENIRSQRYSGAMGLIGSGLILISGGALSLIAGRGDD